VQNSTAEGKRALLDRLTAEHAALKARLRELDKHISLTTEEKLEYARLKKLKLRTKDKIQLLAQA
jgi:uncharacterized protein YdcH (DUF465 family)